MEREIEKLVIDIQKAISEMNGKEVAGREIKVSEAKAREEGQ